MARQPGWRPGTVIATGREAPPSPGKAGQGKRPLEGERHVRTDDFHGASGAEPEGGIPVHVKVVDGGGNDVYVADT